MTATNAPVPPVPVVARRVARRLIRMEWGIGAIVLIGSGADGSWDEHSDVDLAVVRPGRWPWRRREELEKAAASLPRRVQIIPLNLRRLEEDRRQGNPLFAAIRAGRPVGRTARCVARILRRPVRPPSVEWMRSWTFHWWRLMPPKDWDFHLASWRREHHERRCARGECACGTDDLPARVVVNWTLVAECAAGKAPAGKRELRARLPELGAPPEVLEGIAAALRAHHEDRFLNWPETQAVRSAYDWLWSLLDARLGVARTEEYRRYCEILGHPGKGS